jgi:hypothetical protein
VSVRSDQGATVGLLHYSRPTAPQPAIRSAGPGCPETVHGIADDPTWTIIRDGRRIADQLTLDEYGFRLLNSPTKVADFQNEQEVREIYESEVASLLRLHTGARGVVAFDPTLRTTKTDASASVAYRPPVLRVHSDFTDRSAAQTLRDLKYEHRGGDRSRRFAIFQVWRPLSESVDSLPLALADARSVEQSDLFRVERIYPNWVGELAYVTHRPEHRWYWFPRMKRDEAVVFKVYDSLTEGTARWVAHTAFTPRTSDTSALRESIEIRALAFY